MNWQKLSNRGSFITLESIDDENTFLVSEMACKTFGQGSEEEKGELTNLLSERFKILKDLGYGEIDKENLFDDNFDENFKEKWRTTAERIPDKFNKQNLQLTLSEWEHVDVSKTDKSQIFSIVTKIVERYISTREKALRNTKHYLALARSLDVYVATSMRSKEDFKNINNLCIEIFDNNKKIQDINIRYFNPTICAAENHQDKGIIECLMVECAKALLFIVGETDSYGKVAETAMALSLGKPVIFYSELENREEFFKKVHPLTRLIDFSSGVVNGGMVVSNLENLKELIYRIFHDKMEYDLEVTRTPKNDQKYYILKERLTQSEVRLQTNDSQLTKTFWNLYQNKKS